MIFLKLSLFFCRVSCIISGLMFLTSKKEPKFLLKYTRSFKTIYKKYD